MCWVITTSANPVVSSVSSFALLIAFDLVHYALIHGNGEKINFGII